MREGITSFLDLIPDPSARMHLTSSIASGKITVWNSTALIPDLKPTSPSIHYIIETRLEMADENPFFSPPCASSPICVLLLSFLVCFLSLFVHSFSTALDADSSVRPHWTVGQWMQLQP